MRYAATNHGTEVKSAQQKRQREIEGKAARKIELANLMRELEDTAKGAPTAASGCSVGLPVDLQSLPEGISIVPEVAAAMEAMQRATDEARQAIKAAQDKKKCTETERLGMPMRPAEAAVASVQRMGAVLQAAATTMPENLPNLFESLQAIHIEMVEAIPAASVPPVTSEETITLSDGEEDEFLDEFMEGVDGLDTSCTGGDGSGARTEQRRASAKRVLRKALVKVRAKRG